MEVHMTVIGKEIKMFRQIIHEAYNRDFRYEKKMVAEKYLLKMQIMYLPGLYYCSRK